MHAGPAVRLIRNPAGEPLVGGDIAAVLQFALRRGFQVHPDAIRVLESADAGMIQRAIREVVRRKERRGDRTISGVDMAGALGVAPIDEPFEAICETISDPTGRTASGEGVGGFGALFVSRYEKMRALVSRRSEGKSLRRISAIKEGRIDDGAHTCGLVSERKTGSGKSDRLVIEDPTGSLELAVYDEEARATTGSLVTDQFVMVRVVAGRDGGPIAREISIPDVSGHSPRVSASEVYAVLLSDLHVGSRNFDEAAFDGLVSWLSSDEPTARRVGHVLMCGDVVDGVGIYRGQDRDLVLQTAEEQLARLDELVGQIPERMHVVISPGNHDPGRRALPQPAIPRGCAPGLWGRPNVRMVGNPATVSLNGVRVLMYHGQSIDDIVKSAQGLSYDRPAGAMKYLLRARHLCPIYGGSTPVAPETEDMMVIEEAPDIFHSGHVHVVGAEQYRGVLMVNSGTWQKQTSFQASQGIRPTVGRAIVVNLRTLKAEQRAFGLE